MEERGRRGSLVERSNESRGEQKECRRGEEVKEIGNWRERLRRQEAVKACMTNNILKHFKSKVRKHVHHTQG